MLIDVFLLHAIEEFLTFIEIYKRGRNFTEPLSKFINVADNLFKFYHNLVLFNEFHNYVFTVRVYNFSLAQLYLSF